MSNPGDTDSTAITSRRQLAEYLASGIKPADRFRIGTEHEKFGFRFADLSPPPYKPDGIRSVLEGLLRYGGERITDEGNIIGLAHDGSSIAVEPAGQLELSGGTRETLHQTAAELAAHLEKVRSVGKELGLGFLPVGFHPTATRAEMPWMPKGRYAIMRAYMPKVGTLGLDMMTRTCTVQVNLDFASEADMVRKLRVSLALQSLATALFANSPFTEGRPNGFLSYRAQVWTDTDNARSGIPAVMFEDGFGFERYVDWVVDEVPMYFVYRGGRYIDVAGRRFADFMAGRIPELAGITPTVGDFADHTTTIFTDVRLKRFLEMRGADSGRPDMMLAQSALWVGLLYDAGSLDSAWSLVRDLGHAEVVALRHAVPRRGLDARSRGGSLRELGREVVALAKDGLRARRRLDAAGRDERIYLEPLEEIVAGGPTQAEAWLQRYHGPWQGDVRPIFQEGAI